jgi:NADH-quinone oxidoreductase subunit H
LLSSIRVVAQVISYELLLGVLLLAIGITTGSYNMIELCLIQSSCWNMFPLLPFVSLSFIVMLIETNRIPFDMVEAESEIVAGVYTEYSSISFTLFFLALTKKVLSLSLFTIQSIVL